MTPYWIFIIFLISFGLTNTTFAEPDDVEIDWIIEGQITTSQSEINIESSVENDPIFEKQIINFLSPKNEISDDVVEDYLTGSGYTLGGREISIDSKEGQLLNRLLIEQREINKDNFFHTIKYLDRFSDGYVELAEALVDPVRIQNYQQRGLERDFNLKSNLEYF